MPRVYRALFATLSVALLTFGMCANSASAATAASKEKGLLITPVRQYTSIDAGRQKTGTFNVANLTGKSALIKLVIKQFSVADYAYDYRFEEPNNEWLHLNISEVLLQSGESRKIDYSITVPPGAMPGGHYYTLFASADISAGGGLQGTIRAATLLYLIVNGRLVETSQLRGHRMPRFAFGRNVTYRLDILNSGNVHYFVQAAGQLRGFSARQAQNETTHLLLPQKIRRISGNIPAPRLPGVYKAIIGYRKEGGGSARQISQYVIYVPPWSVAALLLLLWIGTKLYRLYKKRKTEKPQTAPTPN